LEYGDEGGVAIAVSKWLFVQDTLAKNSLTFTYGVCGYLCKAPCRRRIRRLLRRLDPLLPSRIPSPQHRLQKPARITARFLDDLLRRAGGDDLTAAVATFRAEVDDLVGGLDDFEIVLDDDHGVALVGEFVQHLQKLLDVVEVHAGGRFVENIERAAGRALG
jgi:hypothetical protein